MKRLATILAAVGALWSSPPADAQAPQHLSARSNYLERCGGCHGVDGFSRTTLIPDLKDKAGYFLCDAEARDYVSRLPNIVFSRITDREMADLMNYVAFDLGGVGATRHAPVFTARELASARRRALSIPDLEAYRARIVDRVIAKCGAPDGLRSEYRTAR
jgi:mono/diheme cytochrome c family protein